MNEPYEQTPQDVQLASEISRHLQNLGVGELHVSVKGGHATISGSVDNFSDKRRVTGDVQGFGGIHGVTNLIRVTGESTTMVESDSNI
ncbi:MAG TPA: BON domain-containing protein [bacterium]|nr:BON domain-containing protein [bacterium]